MNRLSTMEAFVRVIDTGSFSAAARQLRIGQPAVSKAIAQLEDRLGVRLLLRSTHALAPTEAGQNFYHHAKRAIDEIEEADLAARGAGATLSGRLRVCAAVTFARLHIMRLLPDFLALHPALEIDIILDDRSVDLVEAGIDVALRMGVLADSAVTARKLGQGRRCVVATPGYLDKAGTPEAPDELLGHQAIIYDQRGGGGSWTFSKHGEAVTINLGGRIRTNAAEAVREAVLLDLGLTITSEWMFAPELAAGTVRTILDDWTLPAIDLWAVSPTGRHASIKARTFTSFIEARLFGGTTRGFSP